MVQRNESPPKVDGAGLAAKLNNSRWASCVHTTAKKVDTHNKKKTEEEMATINSIQFKHEPVLTVRLPYLDSTIVDLVEVKVNTKVWAKYCHLNWVVMTPKIATGAEGASARLTGMYVRTKYPLNNPLYLHLLTFKFYHGQSSLEGGLEVDHIKNPTINDIAHLRSCTKSENAQGRSGSSSAKVPVKGVWLHSNGSYVVEWQFPGRKGVKITRQKKGMTRAMASELYNRISKHYSPEYAFQNVQDETLTEQQAKLVDTMFESCIAKIEKKLKARCASTSDSDTAFTCSSESPAKRQRLD